MFKTGVKIDDKSARETISVAASRVRNPRGLMILVVRNVARLVRENFRALDSKRSKFGHAFYVREGVNKTTSNAAQDGSSGEVVVESGQMLHKLTGGRVTPKKSRAIAIPVSSWAKSQSRQPASIPDLVLLRGRSGKPFLVRKIELEAGQGSRIRADYILRSSVTHKPRPETIPAASAITNVVRKSAALYQLAETRGSK